MDNPFKTENDIRAYIEDTVEIAKRFNLNSLANAIHSTAKLKGWWDKDRGIPEMIALCHSELSEALEACRKPVMAQSEHIPEFTALEEEIADTIIRLLDMGYSQGCRTGEAIIAKMKFNLQRPHKHGGKKF